MAWKCPRCGFDKNVDDSNTCEGGCGYARIPETITLLSADTGRTAKMAIDTRVGKALLRSVLGDDSQYAAESQFRVYKDAGLGSWVIEPCDGAKNPTFLNGSALSPGEKQSLEDGAVISIGPEKARLTVQMSKS